MAPDEPTPPPRPDYTYVETEERGSDLTVAALATAGTFLGGTGSIVAGAWINSKINPPNPPVQEQPVQVILPPGVDGE